MKETLTQIVKGTAQLDCVRSGGIAEYVITSCNGVQYLLEIDLTDKVDCGATARFKSQEKAITLMRWIRRAMESDNLIRLTA